MPDSNLKIEHLKRKKHRRNQFQCGDSDLDRYIKDFAGQDQKRGLAVSYVLVEDTRVVVYYTLSNYSIYIGNCPDYLRKRLPNRPYITATLIGKFAIDINYQDIGWGQILLLNALSRSLKHSDSIAAFAVCVYAKNEQAKKFYLKYDFRELNDDPYHLFLPMNVIRKVK